MFARVGIFLGRNFRVGMFTGRNFRVGIFSGRNVRVGMFARVGMLAWVGIIVQPPYAVLYYTTTDKALTLIADIATRWNSTYLMLDRILTLKTPLATVLTNSEDLGIEFSLPEFFTF